MPEGGYFVALPDCRRYSDEIDIPRYHQRLKHDGYV